VDRAVDHVAGVLPDVHHGRRFARLACGVPFGLSLLAGVAALLRHRPHRRLLLAFAAVAWIGTIAACWAQLP